MGEDSGLVGKVLLLGVATVAGLVLAGVFVTSRNLDSSAITQRQYDQLQRGQTRTAIENRLGAARTDLTLARTPAAPKGTTCAFYVQKDAALKDKRAYRLCYLRGRLMIKDTYSYRALVRP